MIMRLRKEFKDLRRKGRLKQLDAAMQKCAAPNPRISVTVVGAGDAFINRYWPTLKQYVNEKKISLAVADRMSLKALAAEKVGELRAFGTSETAALGDKLQRGYEEFAAFLEIAQRKSVEYLDLSTLEGKHRYEDLHGTEFVFVLVPDHIHLQEARAWLSRATVVFVEKPYADSNLRAQEFEEEYTRLQESEIAGGGNALVVPFDHYFAKMAPCIRKLESRGLEHYIGEAQAIDFLLTESRQPEAHRLDTLRGGLIADLYPHILAVLSMFAKLETIDHSTQRVKVARVAGNQFPAETYAQIKSQMKSHSDHFVQVTATLGKAIGEYDEKSVIVHGSHGRLVINFTPNPSLGAPQVAQVKVDSAPLTPTIVNMGNICEVYASGHAEFITALLSGNYIKEPCGGLVRNQAHLIMKELDALRHAVTNLKSMEEYKPKEPGDVIAGRATPLVT